MKTIAKPKKKRASDQLVGELARIALKSRREIVQKRAVVAFARANRDSAIGKWFTRHGAWDDSKMAEQRRLELAGELIRVYWVETVDPKSKETMRWRGLVSIPSDRANGGGYRFVRSILADDKMRSELVADALTHLEQIKRKYEHVKALAPIWAAMNEVSRNSTFPATATLAAG